MKRFQLEKVRFEALTSCCPLQLCVHRDFVTVREEALKMIHSAFHLLDQEFQKLHGYILVVSRVSRCL